MKRWLKNKIRKVFGMQDLAEMKDIVSLLNYDLRRGMLLEKIRYFIEEQEERHINDILLLLLHNAELPTFSIDTNYPVAYESNDHIKPYGTKNDNTRSPRFVHACERYFSKHKGKLCFLDIGCSGGGIVFDFLLRGHRAIGIEGSDYSKNAQRACWRLLTDRNLFTADATKPFQLKENANNFSADIISAWEFLEHISEDDLCGLFSNLKAHLKNDGIFVGSVTTIGDCVNEIEYHPTVHPKQWWENKFREFGFVFVQHHGFLEKDFCRGTANGIMDPDFSADPNHGFTFVAKKILEANK